MKVIRAEYAGACYGVQRALDLAQSCIDDGVAATTLGPLIHNPQVVASLASQGVQVADSVADIATPTVIIRSHGVVPQVMDQISEAGLEAVDATCPHVARAQKAAAKLASQGLLVVIVGEDGHPEVEGMKAYAQREGGQVLVVGNASELPDDLPSNIGVVVQTTQILETFEAVIEAIKGLGIEPVIKNTICFATSQRQQAAAALAGEVDAMVVIGGRNSSNTTRLADICRKACQRMYHVEADDVIDPAWFEGCATVGITAGASTPEDQISAVARQLELM